jgi:hypothetical protein
MVASGADLGGRILVLWDAQKVCGTAGMAGRWFDAQGRPVGPIFKAASSSWAASEDQLALRPLLGGGLALSVNGAWVRRFEPSQLAGGPPPDFLAVNPFHEVAYVHQGGAYALAPTSSVNGDQVEVFAASGTSCGRGFYSGAWSCTPSTSGFPRVGLDGTVARSLGPESCDPVVTGAPVCCRYRWWPGALR